MKHDYLIVEKSDRLYAYREDSDHHKVAEKQRRSSGMKKICISQLDRECELDLSMPRNSYIIILIK